MMETNSSGQTRTETGGGEIAVVSPAILCVDDDQNVLDAFQRQFRRKFALQTALGPHAGLQALHQNGPFQIVISDLQMPVMNGIQFLSAVRTQAPETVRIMLTGQADLSAAMAAVNQGAIFRFLVKPCAPAVLEKVLEAGLEQYRLQNAERQVTQETLLGCVHLLVDVLSMVQPVHFGKANRVRRYVEEVMTTITSSNSWQGPPPSWEFEAAALLSQIGWTTLPPDMVDRAAQQEQPSGPASHVVAAAKMIEGIPRLEVVAKIIGNQANPFKAAAAGDLSVATLGGHLLKAALDFDELVQKGVSHEEAISRMRSRPGLYNPLVLTALESIKEVEAGDRIMDVRFCDLAPGMILEDDVIGSNKLCVMGKGQTITETGILRLAGYASIVPPERLCKVRITRAA
jgi:FixJ family two-component response regulator